MIDDMRKDPMMAHLLDSLDRGEDIGHYGRLVFAMIAHHFAGEAEVIATLQQDRDFSDEAARDLVKQVDAAGYSPPKRDKILEYQSRQEQVIIPDPDDPDCGNVYKSLQFPDDVYKHIAEYREQKAAAQT